MNNRKENFRALYRPTEIDGYDSVAHIFALDYYRPGSKGRDEFSRKETWFYYDGDSDLEEEFGKRIESLLYNLFIKNSVEWDILTLAPSNKKDSLNSSMQRICQETSEKLDIEYRQILKRNRNVKETGEMQGNLNRRKNLEGSVDIEEDVEGLNIVLLDNVSIHGFRLVHLTELLLDAGAKRVFSVTLGVTNHERAVQGLEKGVTASSVAIAGFKHDE